MGIDQIILIVVGGIVVIFLVIFPLLIFFAALFEKVNLPTFAALDNEPTPSHAHLAAALQYGYQFIGFFTDGDKGIRKGVYSISLSPDGAVLMLIRHNKLAARVLLMTRPEQG